MRVGNSVTALYSSIFAAATLADGQAKDKRRHEWDEKIAAVKEEVIELVDEEQRIIAALSPRTKLRAVKQPFQIRQYSTSNVNVAHPVSELYTEAETPEQSLAHKDEEFERDMKSDHENAFADETESDLDDIASSLGERDWGQDLFRMKAVHKLAVKQLAIRFLLRPVVGHTYNGARRDFPSDVELPKLKTSDLFAQLDEIGRRIVYYKYAANAKPEEAADLNLRKYYGNLEKSEKLDVDVRRNSILYMRQEIPLPEYLLRLASNLVSSDETDRPTAYRWMMTAFATTRQNDLADMVVRTLIPHRFRLNSILILAILNYYRKSKNLKDFDLFLEILRGSSACKANLGLMAPFRLKIINGMELTVPPLDSYNALTWSSLIIAALRFDQPDRADAWLQSARSHGFMDDHVTICSYLKFCKIRKNWERGVRVMRRALAYMAGSTDISEKRIERMIALMVHLSDECQQYEFSSALIDAAIQSGLHWSFARKQEDLIFYCDPTYRRMLDASRLQNPESQTRETWQKCHSFTNIIREKLDRLLAIANERTAEREKMDDNYSKNILSAEYSDFDHRGYSAKHNESLPADNTTINDHTAHSQQQPADETATSNKRDGEITSLRSEVAQLKQLVLQLHCAKPSDTDTTFPLTTDTNHSPPNEAPGGPFYSPFAQNHVTESLRKPPTSVHFKKKAGAVDAAHSAVEPRVTVQFTKSDQ